MAKTEFYCDICGAPMELEKRLPNHKKGCRSYRRRRFRCMVCDYKKLIIANGTGDEKHWPQLGIDEVNRNFKQEEENRDFFTDIKT